MLTCAQHGCRYSLRRMCSRSGFFWIQCSPAGLAFMEKWLAAAYAAGSLMDVWEQMVFGTLIFTKPPTIRCKGCV